MTRKTNRRKFSILSSAFALLGAVIIATPATVQADPPPFTLLSPTNDQVVTLGPRDNWYLPIQVAGTAPGSDSNKFEAYFYDASGEVAASVTWQVVPAQRIDQPVEWTFKLGLSNLSYVENPVSDSITIPNDAANFAILSATKAPFKNGMFKPGTYTLELFVTNITNTDPRVKIGDVSGIVIGAPNGVKCAPGSYSAKGTWTTKAPCKQASAGYYVPGIGSKNQLITPVGTFVPKSGAAAKSFCREGYYQGKSGQSKCIAASLGYYVEYSNSPFQRKCPAGKYSNELASFACSIAAPGHFAVAGSKSQTPCAIGTYQPNSGKGFCTRAQKGYFVGSPRATMEVPCEAGTYQDVEGKGNCKDATAGHFASGRGAVQQLSCSQGYFSPINRAIECLPAPIGKYVPKAGSSTVTNCPAGKTTLEIGASRLTDCVNIT